MQSTFTKIIAWSNLVTWLLPPLGFFTSSYTFVIAKNSPKSRKYWILASIGLSLSLLNGLTAVYMNYNNAITAGSPN